MNKSLFSRWSRRGASLSNGAADAGWLPSGTGFVGASWFAPAGPRPRRAAVLLVPGIAHEERAMIDGLAALARSLAGAGFGSLLIDLHGTAQSTGRLDNPDIGERWREDIRSAAAHLRAAGFEDLVVVGARLGALLAQSALQDERLTGFIAWAPVLSGRRYVRGLKMLKATGSVAGSEDAGALPGGVTVAGHHLPKAVLAHLGSLNFDTSPDPARGPLLILADGDSIATARDQNSVRAGAAPEMRVSGQLQRWLFSPAEPPMVPHDDIRTLVIWCLQREPSGAASASARPARRRPAIVKQISLACDGLAVVERAVRFGSARLSGVISEPLGPRSPGAARLFATLVGPGRLFPTLAREQAALGKTSLRFDFAGFTSSGQRPDRSGGALYSPRNRDDVAEAVDHLLGQGHASVTMVGFCAGAWSMIHAGPLPGVSGIAAINAQMFRQPDYTLRDLAIGDGHPLAGALALLRRVVPSARTVERIERHLPSGLETGRWLRRLGESSTRPLLIYATDDPGLVHLDRRFGPRVVARSMASRGAPRPASDRIAIGRYHGLGHLLEGSAARARALDALRTYLKDVDERVLAEGAPAITAAPTRAPQDAPDTSGWGGMTWAHSR